MVEPLGLLVILLMILLSEPSLEQMTIIAGPLQRVERWSTIVEMIKVELPSYVEQPGSGITSQDSYDLDNKDDGEWFGLQESYWS